MEPLKVATVIELADSVQVVERQFGSRILGKNLLPLVILFRIFYKTSDPPNFFQRN